MKPVDLPAHIQNAWAFYRSLGSPKFIAAPMVDQSECAFRMLNRRYGTELCYTPMLHSRLMVE
jgi:tRNA-dihydrouridine synthase 1